MNRQTREFLEQQEAVGRARSKAAKRAKRKKLDDRFRRYLNEKAERIEASGNPAAAATFRAFWDCISRRAKVIRPTLSNKK